MLLLEDADFVVDEPPHLVLVELPRNSQQSFAPPRLQDGEDPFGAIEPTGHGNDSGDVTYLEEGGRK